MKNSKLFSINLKEIGKGLLTAILSSVIAGLTGGLQTGVIDPQLIGVTAMSAGLGYIGRKLVTNSDDQFLKAEQN
ncbi:hypothetical protein UFOVP756_37 [uncultured Caudovirales phage]|jgi:hypothetical protein|uniref:Holin n=1 Tax=uncultured Caudovirales phage TaxID=2100421 RepID=A0A6J7X853_9CAUD|nr:hypothetical protein UFOVP756_37 [uncultured Caudovirales phage]